MLWNNQTRGMGALPALVVLAMTIAFTISPRIVWAIPQEGERSVLVDGNKLAADNNASNPKTELAPKEGDGKTVAKENNEKEKTPPPGEKKADEPKPQPSAFEGDVAKVAKRVEELAQQNAQMKREIGDLKEAIRRLGSVRAENAKKEEAAKKEAAKKKEAEKKEAAKKEAAEKEAEKTATAKKQTDKKVEEKKGTAKNEGEKKIDPKKDGDKK